MFTGIIECMGSLEEIGKIRAGRRLSIRIGELPGAFPQPGDSVAVNGVCLTVTGVDRTVAAFDVSRETLSCSLISDWDTGDRVNVERALTLQTPLGGHLVSGHVDGLARVVSRRDEAGFAEVAFMLSADLGKFMAVKGSVSIDGVSLTINQVADHAENTRIAVMLVPHTLEHTTLGSLAPDRLVHVEVDQIARYIYRLGQFPAAER